jgi:hypothetical protein
MPAAGKRRREILRHPLLARCGERPRLSRPQKVVVPRACGVSSTLRLLDSITGVSGILDRPLSRAMTTERMTTERTHTFAIPRRDSPGVYEYLRALNNQRARGMPDARCTRGLACNVHERVRTRAYRFSGGYPTFPAQWLYGLWRALPGDRLSCHRRRAETSAPLDASTGASGPHAFAVRVSHARQSQLPRPPHPAPR